MFCPEYGSLPLNPRENSLRTPTTSQSFAFSGSRPDHGSGLSPIFHDSTDSADSADDESVQWQASVRLGADSETGSHCKLAARTVLRSNVAAILKKNLPPRKSRPRFRHGLDSTVVMMIANDTVNSGFVNQESSCGTALSRQSYLRRNSVSRRNVECPAGQIIRGGLK